MKKILKSKVSIIVILCMSVVILGLTISYIRKLFIISKYLGQEQTRVGEVNDNNEYAIYKVIIESGYINSQTELILINSQTGLGLLDRADLAQEKPWSLEISQNAWNDFSEKNQSTSSLGNSFELSKPYLLVDYDEMEDMNLELWTANVRYTSFLEFSRVGFDEQKNEAIVHIGTALLGKGKPTLWFMFGKYISLKKVDGKWLIEKEQDTYIT